MSAPDAPVSHLTLTTTADAPLTPSEVLSDFADATPRWTYLEKDSHHYADRKDRPALVLRYRRDDSPSLVDFAFAAVPNAPNALRLVLLDAPTAEGTLPPSERASLVDTLRAALQDYLDDRPAGASLAIDRDAPDV